MRTPECHKKGCAALGRDEGADAHCDCGDALDRSEARALRDWREDYGRMIQKPFALGRRWGWRVS